VVVTVAEEVVTEDMAAGMEAEDMAAGMEAEDMAAVGMAAVGMAAVGMAAVDMTMWITWYWNCLRAKNVTKYFNM
jgi:ABC-type transport system involved in cytochrome c biogenesis permease subunit